MKLDKKQLLAFAFAIIIIVVDLIFFWKQRIFYFLVSISAIIIALPFVVNSMLESSKQKENDEMFLEFSRNLVESVRAGTPISKSILNVKGRYYGSLTPYINKLGNQIALGIPVKTAFENFAEDVGSRTISRAVGLISEAEKAGGNIESILDSVASSIGEIEKLKKERKAAIYNLVVQGYIIFLVFIVIMLVLQYKILAMTAGLVGAGEIEGISIGSVTPDEMAKPFLSLLIVQGIFAGLTIGKLAEGNVKSGIKHSFILSILAVLASTGAAIFLG